MVLRPKTNGTKQKEDKTMKKFMTNIKTLAALLIAGAAFTACSSSDDIIAEQPVNPATQKYTLTVKASKAGDATTRALALTGEGNKTLKPYWDGTETVTVKEGTKTLGTLTATVDPSDITKATLSGELDEAPTGENLTLEFCSASYSSQDGTLAYIASNCDYAVATTTVSHSGNTYTGSADFVNQQAIIKFILQDKNNSGAAISPSAFTVSDGTSAVSLIGISAATYSDPNNGEGVLYVAFPAASDAKTIYLTATVGTDTYTYTTPSAKTFTNGQYYAITVKMTQATALATGHALSSAAVGDVVGSDGLAYAGTDYGKLPGGVTAIAKVCYVDATTGEGLALALTDEGAMDWYSAMSACAAHTPAIDGGTWKLATQAEWNNMINANGGAANLRDGFTSVGGSNLIQGHKVYMSSTDVANSSGQAAYAYDFNMGSWTTGGKTSTGANARACLAFTAAPAARALSEATTDDIGKIAGADGYIYDNAAAAAEAGSTAAAMIAYVGSATQPTSSNINASMATYNHGLAIALTEVSNTSGAEGLAGMSWADAGTAAGAYTRARPSASSEWFLPSAYQWMWMLNGCGGGTPTTTLTNVAYSYGNFQTKMQNCGGTQMQSLGSYWSSTESVDNNYRVWRYTFNNGGMISTTGKGDNCMVRSAFAF